MERPDVNYEKLPRGILGNKEAGVLTKKMDTLQEMLQRREQAGPEVPEDDLSQCFFIETNIFPKTEKLFRLKNLWNLGRNLSEH